MAEHADRSRLEQRLVAAREAREHEANARKAEEERVSGEVLLEIENLDENDQIDYDTRVARFRAASEVLRGETATPTVAPGTSPLSDDERELLEAFRSGRLIKTDQGAYRDTEWNTRHPRQARAATPAATATPPGQPAAEPAAPVATPAAPATPPAAAEATPEPGPATPAAPEAPASPPEPAKSTWARLKQAAKNAQQ